MTRFDNVKNHVRDHKELYIVGGVVVLTLGFVGAPKVINVVDAFKIQVNSPTTNVVTTELVRRGHPGTIIKNLETGEVYASISRAAEACGISRAAVRKGFGSSFESLGDAS